MFETFPKRRFEIVFVTISQHVFLDQIYEMAKVDDWKDFLSYS